MNDQPNENRFRDLIAKALSDVTADDIREIIGSAVKEKLTEYECKNIIDAVMTPIVREMLREAAKDPTVLEVVAQRAKSQLMAYAGSFEINKGRY